MSATPFSFPTRRLEAREKYGPAMLIEDRCEADLYFAACVEHAVALGMARGTAEDVERANLAYFAGYYGNDVRARVEALFRCEHPVFGPIAKYGPPSPELRRRTT